MYQFGSHTYAHSCAYYLVHSMGSHGKFEEQEWQAAGNFAEAAREAGIRRIIYLGGLGEKDPSLSAHLRSRLEVADILKGLLAFPSSSFELRSSLVPAACPLR